MRTVAELVAVAAQLSPAELRELRDAIGRLEKNSRALVLQTKGTTYRLVRLDDGEFIECHQRSLAIEEVDGYFLALLQRRHELGFPEGYLTLKAMTGESSRYFDDYKGSISFPFALDVSNGRGEFAYLLEVRNFRSSLEFSVRKVVGSDDPRLQEGRIHPPFADELSGQEISDFIAWFYSQMADYWETIRAHPQEPFLHKVASNGILFGYCGGTCFERQHESDRAYETACKRYESRIKLERAALKS